MDEIVLDPTPPTLDLSSGDDIPRFPCTYKSPARFKSVAANYGNGDLSLLTFNVRSCRRNFSSFVNFLCSLMFKFSLIMLVETWLESGTDCSFDIAGYKQVNLYRNNLGGGIKVFMMKCSQLR